MKLFLSLTPLLIILIGIVGLKKPAKWVSIFAIIYTLIISYFLFNTANEILFTQTKKGIVDGFKMVYMIWSAFLVLSMLIRTGAMNKIKECIANLTTDKRKQVIIIGFCFGGFLEGVAGAGTPAAIAAPFLMILGIPALDAAIASLIFNGIAASLGAAGFTTIGGFTPFLSNIGIDEIKNLIVRIPYLITNIPPTSVDVHATILNISMITGLIHFWGALIAPFIVLSVLWGKKCFNKDICCFSLIVGFCYGISLVVIGSFVGAEFPTICAGIFSLFGAIFYIKYFNKETIIPDLFKININKEIEKNNMKPITAMSTYLLLLILLPLVRFFAPSYFLSLGFSIWIGTTILFVCFLGSIILKSTNNFLLYAKEAFNNVSGALIAMSALLSIANLMKVTGMLNIIATFLALHTGMLYPGIAVFIGSLGSFVTGTTTGSNIMFAPMHYEAVKILNINLPAVLGAQNAGGALGNMICPNNVVAVCATVNMQNSEGLVMRRVFKPIVFLWIVYASLALIYSYILFPLLPVILK